MFKTTLFCCSEGASIDARNNTISAFNIIEQINSPGFPVLLARVCVIALIVRDETDPPQVGLQLIVESGNQHVVSAPVDVNFFQRLSMRVVTEFQGLVISTPGVLRFWLRNGQENLSHWDIMVNQISAPQSQVYIPVPPITGAAAPGSENQ